MKRRNVPRRDFSRHWVFTDRARHLASVARHAVELPARVPAPLFALLLAGLAAAAARGRWEWAVGATSTSSASPTASAAWWIWSRPRGRT